MSDLQPGLGDGTARAVSLTIPARPEYITLCRLALSGLAQLRPLSEETLADLKLALTEACSNSVRHAYAGPSEDGRVEVLYELHPDRVVVEVRDEGGGFELDEPAPTNGGDLSEGGLGIAIIRAIVDELEIGPTQTGRGSRLRFTKLLSD